MCNNCDTFNEIKQKIEQKSSLLSDKSVIVDQSSLLGLVFLLLIGIILLILLERFVKEKKE